MKNKGLLMFIFTIFFLTLVLTLSCAITCGVYYLITLCFGLEFSWKIGAGIWLVLMLISGFLKTNNSNK